MTRAASSGTFSVREAFDRAAGWRPRLRRATAVGSSFAIALVAGHASAATYTVGPSGRQFTQLADVFARRDLAPGDVVLVDGNATYRGGIVVGDDDAGTAREPVVIRWTRAAGESRPRLHGGRNTIKFERADHVVFEGFEVTGGSNACLFSEADDVTVRDSVIHDCPSHGILGADTHSGSFTLEDSELYASGAGTTRHTIYMQSDEVMYPDAQFVMRRNYVHDGTGGVLVRVRHQRSRIVGNWIEGSVYGELELIGPDCEMQPPGWTPDLRREDADIVGNVIVHTNPGWRNAIRAGGDLNGRSQGRVRLLDNTIVFTNAGAANAVMVQLGLGSLEMHNNVVFQPAPGSTPAIVRENPANAVDTPFCAPFDKQPWSAGRKVAGSHNWVQSGAMQVPREWSGTLRGSDPGFMDVAKLSLRPRPDSPLVAAGTRAPVAAAGFPYPSPLPVPTTDPPRRAKRAIGAEGPLEPHDGNAIGAFEPGRDPGPPGKADGAAASRTDADAPARRDVDGTSRPPAAPSRPGFLMRWWQDARRAVDWLLRLFDA